MKSLHALGIKVHWVNRGGGCVLHLPGQLAAYFALPLDTLRIEAATTTSTDCTRRFWWSSRSSISTGSIRTDLPGVFSGPARIATVGVAVSRSIAYHGLTLNVGPYLEGFDVLGGTGDRQGASAVHLDGVSPAAAYGDVQGP